MGVLAGSRLAFSASERRSERVTGKFKGHLNDASNNPIAIDGLWAIAFGSGGTSGPANNLFFAAGPQDESHGLFGFIATVENVLGGDQ